MSTLGTPIPPPTRESQIAYLVSCPGYEFEDITCSESKDQPLPDTLVAALRDPTVVPRWLACLRLQIEKIDLSIASRKRTLDHESIELPTVEFLKKRYDHEEWKSRALRSRASFTARLGEAQALEKYHNSHQAHRDRTLVGFMRWLATLDPEHPEGNLPTAKERCQDILDSLGIPWNAP